LPPFEHPLATRHWHSPSLQSVGRATQPTSPATDELFTQNWLELQLLQMSPLEPLLPLVPLVPLEPLEPLEPLLPLVPLEPLLDSPQASMAEHELAPVMQDFVLSANDEQTSLQFSGVAPHCFAMAAQTSEQDGVPAERPDEAPLDEPDASLESELHAPRIPTTTKNPNAETRTSIAFLYTVNLQSPGPYGRAPGARSPEAIPRDTNVGAAPTRAVDVSVRVRLQRPRSAACSATAPPIDPSSELLAHSGSASAGATPPASIAPTTTRRSSGALAIEASPPRAHGRELRSLRSSLR